MTILYVAEIVGKVGVYAFKTGLADLKKQYSIDFVIACGDGATGGSGLGRNHAAYLHKLGADVLTTGECCFYKKDLVENIGHIPYVLRPFNLNPGAPGIGSRIFKTPRGKIAVAVLLGQSGYGKLHGDNPFYALPALLERLRQETPLVIIDFHAGATAEKRTLFAMAAGNCSAVIGSHTRVQTADEEILPGGTAVITDAGRTGSIDSVGGTDISERTAEYLSGIPDRTRDAWARPELQGVLIELNEAGKALAIERIRHPLPELKNPGLNSPEKEAVLEPPEEADRD
ncbi:MAG: YmdB family metallophosphoesterase [Spirochaetaceae bacterium]|jgi:metallophosphoesterase (TIGR00282 family)|nr:YmdB family metallophosphoesterase [Spirochaetaceae bacterium]